MLFRIYWQLQTCEKNLTALLSSSLRSYINLPTSLFHKIQPLGSNPSTDAWDCRKLLACALLRAPQMLCDMEETEREAERKKE